MDLGRLKTVVSNELSAAHGLLSLKLQNHIYGCFVLMEDIAQDSSANTLFSGSHFDFEKQFEEIGLRYGFIMDTKLALHDVSPLYKAIWLHYLREVIFSRDIEFVDRIEDVLIEVVGLNVKADEAYFMNALETGKLSQEWIGRALSTLGGGSGALSTLGAPSVVPIVEEETVAIEKTALTAAETEKPLSKPRKMATTRRHKADVSHKKFLSVTRRHVHKN